MIRLALAAWISVALAAPAAWAEAPDPSEDAPTEVTSATPEAQVEAKPARKPARRRLTTAERWRGKPYLRSEDAQLRGQALGTALPPTENGFGNSGGLGLQAVGFQAVENETLRRQALDESMPIPLNPTWRSGF